MDFEDTVLSASMNSPVGPRQGQTQIHLGFYHRMPKCQGDVLGQAALVQPSSLGGTRKESSSLFGEPEHSLPQKPLSPQQPSRGHGAHAPPPSMFTCFVGAAENRLLPAAERPVSHPHGHREGLFRVDGDDAIWDADCLSAVELEDLVAVVAVVRGEAHGPVQGAARGREQLGSARRSP